MPLFRRLSALRAAFSDPQIPAVASANAFALDLYGALGGERGNLFFSPFNIAVALAMAASGARGQTAAEMRKVLRLTLPPDRIDAELGEALRKMMSGRDSPPSAPEPSPEAEEPPEEPAAGPDQPLWLRRAVLRASPPREPTRLHFANALWVSSDLALEPRYERSMTVHYSGSLHRLNFETDPEAARQTINHWVEAQTADRIRNLFGSAPGGPMVITAAVYMKADWENQFQERHTEDGDFHTADGSSIRVRLMRESRATQRYLEGDGFQAISLPYRDDDLSMIVFLPRTVDGLAAFERGLGAGKLEGWLSALRATPRQRVSLTLPKFKLDGEYGLKLLLTGLGMCRAFTDQADFSGISRTAPMSIEQAVHKSWLAVDEEGAEAAAATGIAYFTSWTLRAPAPIEFRADHPFLFLVRDERTGAILFMGRLERPTA